MAKIKKATLILVDNHPLFIKGLEAALQHDFSIIATAGNGNALLELLKSYQPDLIIIDLQMPCVNGLSAARQIVVHYPKIKLIMLSVFYDDKIEYQLKEVGVKGYLSKDVESDFLIQQIRLVLDGHIAFFCPKRELYFNGLSGSGNFFLPPHNLSLRELEIVSLIRRGLTSNEIAEKLFISINTVEAHRKHIFKKLHLKNIQGIVEFAFKYSL